MKEIKISEALEKQKEREEKEQVEKALGEEEEVRGEGKNILIAILILIGAVSLFIGGVKVYDYFTGAGVINVDELHKQNLEEELDSKEGYMYEGYSFVYADGLWWTEIKMGEILLKVPLHFGPREITEVKIEGKQDFASFNQGDEVFIAIDPEFSNKYYTLALGELNFNVAKGIKRKPVAACTKNNSICQDREILSCNNTKGKPVIELKYGGEAKIKLEGSCILVSGEEYGLVKAADRLILQWYGVMK